MKKIYLNNEEKVTLALIVAVIVIAIIAVIIKIIIDFIPEKVYYAKHILVEDKKTAKEVIEKLDNGYGFCELVEEYSIDTTDKCGYVGKFKKGEMVEEFEKATKKLKYNEYTKEPIKTEYGYHIILRIKSEVKSNVDNDEQINEESSNNTSSENDVENSTSTSNNETNTSGNSGSNNTNNSNSNSNSNNNNSNSTTSSNTKTEKTIDATKEYYCIEPFTLNGTKCENYISLDAMQKYVCEEGTLSGTKCQIQSTIVHTPNRYGGYADYCYSLYGSTSGMNFNKCLCNKEGGSYNTATQTCYKTVTATKNASLIYYCSDGYSLNHNKCEKYYVTEAPFKLTCPSGYALSGTTCKK